MYDDVYVTFDVSVINVTLHGLHFLKHVHVFGIPYLSKSVVVSH